MDENREFATGSESHGEQAVKWFRYLFYIHIGTIIISILSVVPGLNTVTSWISRWVTVGIIVVLFRLTPVNGRYHKAAVLMCVSLGLLLFNTVMATVNALLGIASFFGSVLTLAASVCSIIANYQEYYAHADMIKEQDSALARKWHSLFNWQIILGVLAGMVSAFAVMLAALLGMAVSLTTTAVLWATSVLTIILRIIYLRYLNRMLQLFDK